MNFFDLIEHRYSVRAYKADPVERYKLEKVLEAAWLAPTAANRQPFHLYIIDSAVNRNQLHGIYSAEWFVQAPVVICACAVKDKAWKRSDGKNYAYVDTAIAMDHLILAAAELGLGTCWVAAFDIEAAKKFLKLDENLEPVAFTPLGYAADEARPKKRADISQLIEYIKS